MPHKYCQPGGRLACISILSLLFSSISPPVSLIPLFVLSCTLLIPYLQAPVNLQLVLVSAHDIVEQSTQVVPETEDVKVSTTPKDGVEETTAAPRVDTVGVSAIPQLVEGVEAVPQPSSVGDAVKGLAICHFYSLY